MSGSGAEKLIIVLTTTANEAAAGRIARSVVEAGLAGCVQILPAIKSIYAWKGEIIVDGECLLLLKTTEQAYSRLEAHILAIHEYETPEIVAIAAEKVTAGYMQWLLATVKSS